MVSCGRLKKTLILYWGISNIVYLLAIRHRVIFASYLGRIHVFRSPSDYYYSIWRENNRRRSRKRKRRRRSKKKKKTRRSRLSAAFVCCRVVTTIRRSSLSPLLLLLLLRFLHLLLFSLPSSFNVSASPLEYMCGGDQFECMTKFGRASATRREENASASAMPSSTEWWWMLVGQASSNDC